VTLNVTLTLWLGSTRPELIGLGATVGLMAGFLALFVVARSRRHRWLEQG